MVFLVNPNPELYNTVNHINFKRDDYSLDNLEWVTSSTNCNKKSGKSTRILKEYAAIDPDSGEEVFRLNVKSDQTKFGLAGIRDSIKRKAKYKGYYWKVIESENKYLKQQGYSGNINDYIWEELFNHPNYSICKEGFIKDNKSNKIVKPNSDSNGYLLCFIDKNSYRIHRLAIEHVLKRKLTEDEIIDHINNNKIDSSFSNLKVTDIKGNMNNPLTKLNKSNEVILADMFGDLITYGPVSSFKEIITSKIKLSDYLDRYVIEDKFICISTGDKDELRRKLSNSYIIFVFNKEKTKAISAFVNTHEIVTRLGTKMQTRTFNKYYVNTDRDICGYIFMSGEKAVDLLEELGHLNAYKYNPDEDPEYWKNKIESRGGINNIEFSELTEIVKPKIRKSSIINLDLSKLVDNNPPDRMITVKLYDLKGNYIKSIRGINKVSKEIGAIGGNFSSCLSTRGYLLCREGEENIIKEKVKYIFHKIDKYGNIVKSTSNYRDKPNAKIVGSYLNTGMLAPDGFYYQQGLEPIEPDPTNVDLIPKRPILKWDKDKIK